MVVEATLCEIIHGGRILLQRKSAGRFGEGKWNGPGGKVKPGETPLECVVREVWEETGLTASCLAERGVVDFYFGEKPEPDWVVHIYTTSTFSGVPNESDEGEIRWFSLDEIPYDDMWEDDAHWLPVLLEGKRFRGVFIYDVDGTRLLRHRLDVLE